MEYSIVMLSDVINELPNKFRLDSEHYKPSYLKNIKTIKKFHKGFQTLDSCIHHMTGGATPLGANYLDKGVLFVRVQNIMQNYFNFNDNIYISEDDDKKLSRSKLKYKDVLLTITGVSYGKSATVTRELEGANINQHSVKITLNENLNPFFLSTFLNSKFGKLQSDRNIVGITRPALDYETIRSFLIPSIDKAFQNEIEILVDYAFKETKNARNLQNEANHILLEELELLDWKPKEVLCYKKNYSDTVKVSRLDAEYFKPMYDEIEDKIKSYKGGWDKLSNLIDISNKTIKPEKDFEYEYIELADINQNMGLVDNTEKILGQNLPSRAKMKVKKGDVLVSSVKGSKEKVAIITSDRKNLVASTGFFIIREKYFTPEVNLLLMKSLYMQTFFDRMARGMILSASTKGDFENVILPKLDNNIQKIISEKVITSHTAKDKSKHLLDIAKKAVEIAIEKGEEKGLYYINKQKEQL